MIRDWNESFSLIRFLHAIPEGEEVDVYINDTPFYEDLDFADFSPYVYVPKGSVVFASPFSSVEIVFIRLLSLS